MKNDNEIGSALNCDKNEEMETNFKIFKITTTKY